MEKIIHHRPADFKGCTENGCEINPVKGGFKRKLRIIKYDILELNNGIHNNAVPVFAACLYHAVRKPVKRDIKDVPFALKPGGKPAQFIMMFKKQYRVTGSCQPVCGCHAAQSRPDYN